MGSGVGTEENQGLLHNSSEQFGTYSHGMRFFSFQHHAGRCSKTKHLSKASPAAPHILLQLQIHSWHTGKEICIWVACLGRDKQRDSSCFGKKITFLSLMQDKNCREEMPWAIYLLKILYLKFKGLKVLMKSVLMIILPLIQKNPYQPWELY